MAEHPHHHKVVSTAGCCIVTVSDTRSSDNDVSGNLIADALNEAGHHIIERFVIKDDPAIVRELVLRMIGTAAVQAVLVTGGTGLAPRDNTYEALHGLFDKRIDGFGELFRMLSFESIGSAAMLSRATAGIVGKTVVFSMPGSPGAVSLAMEKLILPQLGHVLWLMGETGLPSGR